MGTLDKSSELEATGSFSLEMESDKERADLEQQYPLFPTPNYGIGGAILIRLTSNNGKAVDPSLLCIYDRLI